MFHNTWMIGLLGTNRYCVHTGAIGPQAALHLCHRTQAKIVEHQTALSALELLYLIH